MAANGRRSTQRLRRHIEDEARDYRRDVHEEACGTAITNLSGFDRRVLARHDLSPVTSAVARCGTAERTPRVPKESNAPILPLIESHAIH
jgi:hypothetical protein